MRIMVRTLRGDRVALDVDGATTVAQAKGMVMARERIPVAMQRLFFAGRHLDDDHRALAHYGVQHDSVVFLSLRLDHQEMHSVQMQQEGHVVMKQEQHQQQRQLQHVHEVAVNDGDGDEDEAEKAKRKPVSRRSLRKILSRLPVDVWTSQRDAKFLDLLLRHTGGGGGRNVGNLTGEDWSAIRAELNAATGSGFSVHDLQRRLGEFRREFDAMSRTKNHSQVSYDDRRRRVAVGKDDDWKLHTLENPEAVAHEGRSQHLGRLGAIFSGDGGRRESRAKRCLRKLLRNFGLRCKL